VLDLLDEVIKLTIDNRALRAIEGVLGGMGPKRTKEKEFSVGAVAHKDRGIVGCDNDTFVGQRVTLFELAQPTFTLEELTQKLSSPVLIIRR
jgi:hypothetical protein